MSSNIVQLLLYMSYIRTPHLYLCSAHGCDYMQITIKSQVLFFLFLDLAGQNVNGYAWIGTNDKAVEGTWVISSSGDLPSYTNWNPGAPNGHEGNDEDCAMLTNFGSGPHWYDVACMRLGYVICESEM